ncbi:MAG: class I SAM-dependent methyltransferase [Saprospirales bacterium]|nr:class I SAM-dependent methyltransferase [Saprospirales bacterium]
MPPTHPSHWNAIYQKSQPEKLGWYEAAPQPSLGLINACNLPKDARMLHVGVGASTLLDALLEEDYSELIACDISEEALLKAQDRLGAEARKMTWIVDDLTDPNLLAGLAPVDLWHDRAVLHFLPKKKTSKRTLTCSGNCLKPVATRSSPPTTWKGWTNAPDFPSKDTTLTCWLSN